jgi:hypothetical protein
MVIYGDGLHTPWLAVLLVRLADTCYDAYPGTLLERANPPADWGFAMTYRNHQNRKVGKPFTNQTAIMAVGRNIWTEHSSTMYNYTYIIKDVLLVLLVVLKLY